MSVSIQWLKSQRRKYTETINEIMQWRRMGINNANDLDVISRCLNRLDEIDFMLNGKEVQDEK